MVDCISIKEIDCLLMLRHHGPVLHRTADGKLLIRSLLRLMDKTSTDEALYDPRSINEKDLRSVDYVVSPACGYMYRHWRRCCFEICCERMGLPAPSYAVARCSWMRNASRRAFLCVSEISSRRPSSPGGPSVVMSSRVLALMMSSLVAHT